MFANTTGREKCMFATNFPQLGWKACVDNVNKLLVNTEKGFRERVVKDFMGGNALRVMKLPIGNFGKLKSNL